MCSQIIVWIIIFVLILTVCVNYFFLNGTQEAICEIKIKGFQTCFSYWTRLNLCWKNYLLYYFPSFSQILPPVYPKKGVISLTTLFLLKRHELNAHMSDAADAREFNSFQFPFQHFLSGSVHRYLKKWHWILFIWDFVKDLECQLTSDCALHCNTLLLWAMATIGHVDFKLKFDVCHVTLYN